MSTFIDLTGQTFERWTVIRREASRQFACGTSSVTWFCRCACGVEKVIQGTNLRSGHSRSCGCLMKEIVTTHGAARGYGRTAEYGIWQAMRGRCRVTKSGGYERYGGRGIIVCERWDKFENFLADMGKRPSPSHSIDRINNDGNYEPVNCRWATVSEQQMNKRTSRNSASGVTGVLHCRATGRWHAWIKIHGESLFLGSFEARTEAVIARVAAVRVRDAMLAHARYREAA